MAVSSFERCGVLGVLGVLGICGCDGVADPGYPGEPLLTVHGTVEATGEARELAVGVLWLEPASDPIDDSIECALEPSDVPPGPCAAACGVPTCEQLAALEDWSRCTERCDDSSGFTAVAVDVRALALFSGAVGQTARVEGEFPAKFRLDVLQPPPARVLARSSTGERIAFGLFVALDARGAPFELALGERPSFPEWLLGGSGTHLLVFTPGGIASRSQMGVILGFELDPGFQLVETSKPTDLGDDVSSPELIPASADGTEVRLTVTDPAALDWPLSDFWIHR